MKLVQINATANWGSTGKIVEQIGAAAICKGWDSYIVCGRHNNESKSHLIKVGNKFGVLIHYVFNRVFDKEGLCSDVATRKFVSALKEINPDIVHLHNIHDHWLNYKLLFEYLNSTDIKVVWTFHDFWAITGHCTHFIRTNCQKWQETCMECPLTERGFIPIIDHSKDNFEIKKILFSESNSLTIVPVSEWVAENVRKSFLKDKRICVIPNGIDTSVFRPSALDSLPNSIIKSIINEWDGKFVIMSVASQWKYDKGLNDYKAMSKLLKDDEIIVLVGVDDSIISHLPHKIIGIKRTNNQYELAALYTRADVVTIFSSAETFGMTVVEGYACGTPAVVYNNTAPPSLISCQTGFVVTDKDYRMAYEYIQIIKQNGKTAYSQSCIDLVKSKFTVEQSTESYLRLYDELIDNYSKE